MPRLILRGQKAEYQLRIAAILLMAVLLSACGAASAAHETGRMFDKYGCLARDFKGEKPCPESE